MYPYTDALMKEVWELCPVRKNVRLSPWTEEFDARMSRWQADHGQWVAEWPANDEHGVGRWGLDAYQATYLLMLAKYHLHWELPFDSDLLSELLPRPLNQIAVWKSDALPMYVDSYFLSRLFEKIANPGSWNSNGNIQLGTNGEDLHIRPNEIPRLGSSSIEGAWQAEMGQVPAFFENVDKHIQAEGGYDEDAFIVNWNGLVVDVYISRGKTLLHLRFQVMLNYVRDTSIFDSEIRPPAIVAYNVRKDVQRVTRVGSTVRLQFHGEHVGHGGYVRNPPLSIEARSPDMARRLHEYLEKYRG